MDKVKKVILALTLTGLTIVLWIGPARHGRDWTRSLAWEAIDFYQHHLAGFRPPDAICPSFPSCSEYARAAIREHGAVLGTFMAVDRLWRETARNHGPLIYRDGRPLFHDPLEANDYWLDGVSSR